MNYKDSVKAILKKIKGDYFEYEENLITGGLIDSFCFVRLVKELENTFEIKIPLGDIKPQSFDSVAQIVAEIERLTNS